MSEESPASLNMGSPLYYFSLLFLIFLILKLTDKINWSWWWVTSPLWVSLGLALIATTIYCIYYYIESKQSKKKESKTVEELYQEVKSLQTKLEKQKMASQLNKIKADLESQLESDKVKSLESDTSSVPTEVQKPRPESPTLKAAKHSSAIVRKLIMGS
jgi:uncharacterized membrane protein YhiD involved in acid resistance